MPVPPESQRRSVLDYLDHETAEIDAFITDLQELRNRLNEENAARIHAGVTGRLGRSGELFGECTEWTGPLPQGWQTPRLSWVFRHIGSGTTPQADDEEAFDGDIPWVVTGELRETHITHTHRRISPTALRRYSALEVFPRQTLLIAMYGATVGRLGWLETPAAVNQAVCAMSGYEYGDFKYMFYVLSAARPHLLSRAVGGGQPNINQELIRSLRVPLPPRGTQDQIVNELERSLSDVREMSALAERAIDFARERRSALISAVVTGQVDVGQKHRPVAEQLEDEVQQLS
ncbi:hypothetical protein GCM10020260_04430 [Nesterenkonia halobia]|uniref:Type I restriction modification DNA specificity domain-containing protein n=1 Tax=Nesterenkonia halobia TaxID=37922 RepID=A0ABP6R9D0_9MICC